MEKETIVKVLRSMLTDWKDSEKFRTANVIRNNHTGEGFCHWLGCNNLEHGDHIIEELQKDLEIKRYKVVTWYPTWVGCTMIDNGIPGSIFKKRINHLERTISRLENELTQAKQYEHTTNQ